jgi:hypothetical protein
VTGRINALSEGNASGFILTENGVRVHFELSVLLAYDAAGLAVGQSVTFDFKNGSSSEAVNVCVQRAHDTPPSERSRPESAEPRYMGFQQQGNLRAYRFERTSSGHRTQTFVLTVDLALFTKHRVAIQEGPALCLRVLLAQMDELPLSALTDGDFLTHLASRPAPASKRPPRFSPRKAAV